MIIPLREFQLHASTYLPITEEIELTRYGKTVARILPASGQVPGPIPKIVKTPDEVINVIKENQPNWKFCEHNAREDLCGKCLAKK